MTTQNKREQLQEYIGIAEQEKVEAMYTLFHSWIEEKRGGEDEGLSDELVAEMDAEYEAMERGEVKGYTLAETMEHLREQRKQRLQKNG